MNWLEKMITNEATASEIRSRVQKRETKVLFFFLKRIFDILFAVLMLLLLIPLTIIFKIAFMLTGDAYPIIYKHTRVGKNDKEFVLYKFRTMVPNSDKMLKELLKQKKFRTEWKANHKLDNDPRITKLGKFLRKASIDELPQAWNILKGEMSLIGPRPLTREEVEEYNEDKDKLLSVKPGLTGWWACNGRSDAEDFERRDLELYYCECASLKLDIKCFFLTIAKVIKGEGAK